MKEVIVYGFEPRRLRDFLLQKLPDELIVGPSVAGAGMTFARAGHGLMRGGWRCLVRFRFVGGNFVGGSMSILTELPIVLRTSVTLSVVLGAGYAVCSSQSAAS
jgi:hypothetical protein